MKEFIDALIDFSINTHLEKIPLFYYDAFLNYLGVTCVGAKQEVIDQTIETIIEDRCGNYQPLFHQEKLPLSSCALVDCFSSAILAYDDIHFETTTHPCGPVASGLLALARKQKVSLKQFLEALCIGMEVECRLGLAFFLKENNGWYTTGIVGAMATAVAIGKLLNFNKEQYKNVLAFSANLASGTRGSHGSAIGSFIPAFASYHGYMAAMYTQKGISANINSLIGKNGLMMQIIKTPHLKEAMENLNKQWISMQVSSKPYPYGFISYAILSTLNEINIDITKCKKIEVEVSKQVYQLGNNKNPQNNYDAFVSLPYIIAHVLVDKKNIYQPMIGKFLITKEEQEIINKIVLKENETLTNQQTIMIIDEQRYQSNKVLGTPQNEMKHQDIIEKFKRLTNINNQFIEDYYHQEIKDIYHFIKHNLEEKKEM